MVESSMVFSRIEKPGSNPGSPWYAGNTDDVIVVAMDSSRSKSSNFILISIGSKNLFLEKKFHERNFLQASFASTFLRIGAYSTEKHELLLMIFLWREDASQF